MMRESLAASVTVAPEELLCGKAWSSRARKVRRRLNLYGDSRREVVGKRMGSAATTTLLAPGGGEVERRDGENKTHLILISAFET